MEQKDVSDIWAAFTLVFEKKNEIKNFKNLQ